MVARPLGASRMILCASPAYLARHGVPGTPSDLEHGHQFVLVRETATSALEAWAVRRGSEMRWLDARPRLIVNRPEAALAPLVAGAGIGELCAFLAESYLRSGDLVELLPHWQDHRITAYVHRPFRTLRNDAVEAFIAFLDELAIGGKSSADTDADTARCHALPLPALPAGR
jgi:DNA-binding transcriptional LysR family regulator